MSQLSKELISLEVVDVDGFKSLSSTLAIILSLVFSPECGQQEL